MLVRPHSSLQRKKDIKLKAAEKKKVSFKFIDKSLGEYDIPSASNLTVEDLVV